MADVLTCVLQIADPTDAAKLDASGSIPNEQDPDPLTQAVREEGMGTTYKFFAITPQSVPVPMPF